MTLHLPAKVAASYWVKVAADWDSDEKTGAGSDALLS